MAASGVEFETELPQTLKSLEVFTAGVAQIDPIAYDLQGYAFNRIVFDSWRDRLTQAMVGELTLEEALQRAQEDIDAGLAETETE